MIGCYFHEADIEAHERAEQRANNRQTKMWQDEMQEEKNMWMSHKMGTRSQWVL